MKKIAILLALTMGIAGTPAFAIDGPLDEGLARIADNKSYAVKVPGMLLYGLYEIGESPLEPLHRPMDETFVKKDYAFGMFRGLNKGSYNFLNGLTRGTFDIFRSFVPGMGRYEDKDHQSKIVPDFSK